MGASFRVLLPDAPKDKLAIEKAAAGAGVRFDCFNTRVADEIPAAAWRAADGLMVRHSIPITKAIVDRLPRCRMVIRVGVGFDIVDLEATGAAGIAACNVPDYGTTEVADHAIALMMSLTRGLVTYRDQLRADPRAWVSQTAPLVRRHRGKRFGIVGLGRIGSACALRAKALGFEVIAFDPHVASGQELAIGVQRARSLNELLSSVDVVSLHTPLTKETRGLINQRALKAMKRDAILINTSRGPVVDIDALADALKAGRIGGAALDVLPKEPPDEHPLLRAFQDDAPWQRGRLILTPHAAWYSPESESDLRRLATETMMLYLRDGVLRNCVNEEFLTRRRA
jgi:D-3-phosphoglycerate dehydrogenase